MFSHVFSFIMAVVMLDVSTGQLRNSDVSDVGDENYKYDKTDEFPVVTHIIFF
jgi:hypothetical protein